MEFPLFSPIHDVGKRGERRDLLVAGGGEGEEKGRNIQTSAAAA